MRRVLLVLLPLCCAAAAPLPRNPPAAAPAPAQGAQAAPAAAAAQAALPAEVVKVVDGDTIHVRLDGKVEKLRLLCVDTEEKLGSGASSPTKPATVFGEECALWAQKFFAALAKDGKPATLGLRFPGGVRQRDVYGRLLCHVILPDGTDYNVMLVREGKSPYFTKYGRSELCHEAFVAAQKEAQAAHRGIWDPHVNEPATPGAPAAKRPYDRLLPWWDARAEAVAAFHARAAQEPGRVFDALEAASLEAACKAEGEALVFGEMERVIDEENGSRTVYLRATERDRALRVRIPKESVEALKAARLDEAAAEFRQNYLWFRGRVAREGRGFAATCTDPGAWKRAGPEPAPPVQPR